MQSQLLVVAVKLHRIALIAPSHSAAAAANDVAQVSTPSSKKASSSSSGIMPKNNSYKRIISLLENSINIISGFSMAL